VETLLAECAPRNHRGEPRSRKNVALAVQRYLLFAILACVPDRQRTLRVRTDGQCSPRHQTHFEPWYIESTGICDVGTRGKCPHIIKHILNPHFSGKTISYGVASTDHQSHPMTWQALSISPYPRELEVGRTLFCEEYEEVLDDVGEGEGEGAEGEQGGLRWVRARRWVVKHSPDDYKTGGSYGERPALMLDPRLYPVGTGTCCPCPPRYPTF